MLMHIGRLNPMGHEKSQNLKIEDGRRPSFRKWKSSFTLL